MPRHNCGQLERNDAGGTYYEIRAEESNRLAKHRVDGFGAASAEIVELCLEDIDWRAGTLVVRKTKQRRGRLLPLPRGRRGDLELPTYGPSQWATRGNSSRRKKKTRRWPKPASGSSELHYLLELSLSVAEVGRDRGYREPRGASRRGGPRLEGCLAAPQPAGRV
jgi:hypothetical protein